MHRQQHLVFRRDLRFVQRLKMQLIHQQSPDPREQDLPEQDLPLEQDPLNHKLVLQQTQRKPLRLLHLFLNPGVQLLAVHGLGITVPVLTTEAHP